MTNSINGVNSFNKDDFMNAALSQDYDVNEDGVIDEKDYELLEESKDDNDNANKSDKLKNLTTSELTTMLDNFNTNLENLNKELEKLNKEQKELERAEDKAKRNQENAEDDYETSVNNFDSENELLNEMMENFNNVQSVIESNDAAIKQEERNNKANYDNKINTTKNQAASEYSQQEHKVSKEEYINSKTSAVQYTSGNLNNLNYLATNYSNQAFSLNSEINEQSNTVGNANNLIEYTYAQYAEASSELVHAETEVSNNNKEISNTQQNIESTTANANAVQKEIDSRVEGSGMTGTEVLSKISDAEKKLAIDNNVDLKTCKIAMGADSNWHIYDANGTSLARTYGSNGGYDIVASGSGYMRNVQTGAEGENARAVYTFSNVNADLTEGCATWEGCCYCTCSPLSFDVNGDGIKTTTSTISYDIDGDGKKDTINDSQDWVLAFDKDQDGVVGKDGSELFGNNTDLNNDGKKDGYKDGFEALKALATQEGLISDNDNVLDENDIQLLSEKYGLSMKQGYNGEVKSLQELGITEITLAKTSDTTLTKNFDGQHNDIMTQDGAEFTVNNEKRKYADIWNVKH